jgi:hypothetical protein
MLPLDHFEGDAEIVEDGHGKIVKQFSVLSSQFSVLSSQFSVLSSQNGRTWAIKRLLPFSGG